MGVRKRGDGKVKKKKICRYEIFQKVSRLEESEKEWPIYRLGRTNVYL